jgi:hypothetical protein
MHHPWHMLNLPLLAGMGGDISSARRHKHRQASSSSRLPLTTRGVGVGVGVGVGRGPGYAGQRRHSTRFAPL